MEKNIVKNLNDEVYEFIGDWLMDESTGIQAGEM
tara:strand:+ start:362 stop:463 length:102 start_codon:yes stop_codon:yes gene_type:complete